MKPSSALRARVDQLPTDPGCYLFKDKAGKVLYVGKALNLRSRVRQYVSLTDSRQMVPFLVAAADDVECVVTVTEKDALILENTLIKKHRPRYNIKLRDDKNFLHLRLDTKKPWPRFELVRRIRQDKARYFGPFHSASQARHSLAFVQRAFPLRTCTDQVLASRRRPCLLHQMGRCTAPCMPEHQDKAEYQALMDAASQFLRGRRKETLQHLKQRMASAAEALDFEQAARLRDLVFSLESTLQRQQSVDTSLRDQDVWGWFRSDTKGTVAMIPYRAGAMGEPIISTLKAVGKDEAGLWSTLLNQAYPPDGFIPGTIMLPVVPEGHEVLEEVLSERRGARVKLQFPQRGAKLRLVDLACENARQRYQLNTDEEARHQSALAEIARALKLDAPPRRMECFDNSHLQGQFAVAAMAVFIDGRPKRSEYRRYRIKSGVGGDDYGSMREVLTRRFERGMREGNLPDLLVVDGGKGQLGVAVAVLQDLGLHHQPVCGIAKPRTERKAGKRHAPDKIYLPGLKDPLKMRRGDAALRILQHIRDEVHNAAIRYHRKVRGKDHLVSVLEGIAGVGPARRKALLVALGSAEGVASATVAQIGSVPGIGPELARAIHEVFHGEQPRESAEPEDPILG